MKDPMSMMMIVAFSCVALELPGCRTADGMRMRRPTSRSAIRQVHCLYDQKPFFSVDKAGDRDPEAIQYRIFLDPGTGHSVLRKGVLHIQMYQIDATSEGVERTLVSDWIYPTSSFAPIRSKLLGMGYHVKLRWASKEIAGHEIELVTRFEDANGKVIAAAGTKRLRVPTTTE